MRFIIFGAGAVGGVIGGRLAQHGHDVVFIARGKQYAAIQERGLQIESPEGNAIVKAVVVDHPSRISWTAEDVVLLTMKTQDTPPALSDLARAAPAATPIVCVQNSVENERMALRRFAHVYGVCVMCPAGYLVPGIVQAWSSPTTGILDIGRYPAGVDPLAGAIAAAFCASTFVSEARPDIMRWKYGKLLMNLGNAVQAICGPQARSQAVSERARREGIACFEAAGIDYTPEREEMDRRGDLLRTGRIGEAPRPGGSSWQSLERRTKSIEADYFNGEVALLGRLHRVPTPVNIVLQRLANEMALDAKPPGSVPVDDLLALLPDRLR